MAKRNKIRAITDQDFSTNYSNKRTITFLDKVNFSIETSSWECPDGTGFWFVTSYKSYQGYKVVSRVKVDNEGNVIEELSS